MTAEQEQEPVINIQLIRFFQFLLGKEHINT